MSQTTEMDPTLSALAASLGGRLIRAGDADWDTVRAPWNRAVEQDPAAVAIPATVDDLRQIVAAARAGRFEIAVQPNGHGASSDVRGCILVRTSAFDEVAVNVDERYARIGAGVKWGAVLPRLTGTGLIALAGTNPDVTVAGYLLSGGHSWFSRWKGLAAHSIRAVEFVDAHGRSRRLDSAHATAEGDAELLWAMRGAAGMLGIVTALEIDLHPAPALFGGKILFPIEAAGAVLDTVAAIMATAPDELTMFAGLINMPDVEMVPEPMRGHSFATVDVVFVGDADTAGTLLAPLLSAAPVIANLMQPFDIGHLGEVSAEPADPVGSLDWNAAIRGLGDDGFAPLIEAFREATPAGLTMVQLRPLGGAIADPAPDATGIVGHLESKYLVFAGAILLDPSRRIDPAAVFGPIDRALTGMTERRMVPTLLSPGQDLSAALPPESLARLGKVKFAHDPDSLFRSNRRLPG